MEGGWREPGKSKLLSVLRYNVQYASVGVIHTKFANHTLIEDPSGKPEVRKVLVGSASSDGPFRRVVCHIPLENKKSFCCPKVYTGDISANYMLDRIC